MRKRSIRLYYYVGEKEVRKTCIYYANIGVKRVICDDMFEFIWKINRMIYTKLVTVFPYRKIILGTEGQDWK